MQVHYDSKTDVLYICFNESKDKVTNKELNEDMLVDLDETGKIVGIEILDASRNMTLTDLLPVSFRFEK